MKWNAIGGNRRCNVELVNYPTRKEITVNVKCEIRTDEEAGKKITANAASTAFSNKENSVKRVILLVKKGRR